jgi:hypothetical protein
MDIRGLSRMTMCHNFPDQSASSPLSVAVAVIGTVATARWLHSCNIFRSHINERGLGIGIFSWRGRKRCPTTCSVALGVREIIHRNLVTDLSGTGAGNVWWLHEYLSLWKSCCANNAGKMNIITNWRGDLTNIQHSKTIVPCVRNIFDNITPSLPSMGHTNRSDELWNSCALKSVRSIKDSKLIDCWMRLWGLQRWVFEFQCEGKDDFMQSLEQCKSIQMHFEINRFRLFKSSYFNWFSHLLCLISLARTGITATPWNSNSNSKS